MNPKGIILLAFIGILTAENVITDIDYSQGSSWKDCPVETDTADYYSPIDFSYFVPTRFTFPAYPKFVLNNTFYKPINNLKFTYLESKNSPIKDPQVSTNYRYLGMSVSGYGSAFFLYLNKTVTYDLKELRLHVYSEHTFEGHKMDLELQLVHEKNSDKTDQSIVGSDELNNFLTMSVLFSIARDKKSKFIEDIIEEDEDRTDERLRYKFAFVKSLDLNQFFNFNEPYYLYKGSGTTPFDCGKPMTWLVNKKVEYLSEKQMRQIQIAMMDFYIDKNSITYHHYPNGNSRIVKHNPKTIITYVENTDRDGDDV